jgi:uncharacterized surface protein with fasciclin (FAS1) repeats
MTSCSPNTQPQNYTHMMRFQDYSGEKFIVEDKNSIYGLLLNHPDFTLFTSILEKSDLYKVYNDSQANFTLFAVSDKYLKPIKNQICQLDLAMSRHIIEASTILRRIPSELIEDSPVSYFYTKDPNNKLFITNISGQTYINNDIKVITKDILANNGIIHCIDKLIIPDVI